MYRKRARENCRTIDQKWSRFVLLHRSIFYICLGNVRIAELLLKGGADVNAVDTLNSTSLQDAVSVCTFLFVFFLLPKILHEIHYCFFQVMSQWWNI